MIEKKYRVALSDTDAAGRIYFAVPPNWFHGLLEDYMESKNFPLFEHLKGPFHWPVVNLTCNYKRSLTVGDKIILKIPKIEQSQKSFTVFYQAIKDSEIAIEASITHVCLDFKTGKPILIPEELKRIF